MANYVANHLSRIKKLVRTTNTSDGKIKIYGWSKDGKQIIVILTPGEHGADIESIKRDGKWVFYEGARTC